MKTAPHRQQLAIATTSDPRWPSILARNTQADGSFVYAVTTTGVFCRPSCAARRARPENVRFFSTPAAAEQAGFRACKRCHPAENSVTAATTTAMAKVCHLIESADEPPSLNTLAQHAGLSVSHLHRTFKAVVGLTPHAYATAHRSRRVRHALASATSVIDAIYTAGFNSSSRFYEKTNEVLGMTPTSFRNGGANTTIHFAVGECSLGSILVAQSERGICAVLLDDDPNALLRDLQARFPRAELLGGEAGYEDVVARVIALVEQPALGLDLPLDIRGTAFQQRVWTALRAITVGTTASYTEIARAIGMPAAARAVAKACGANALAVAIPCHRVVRSDGDLSGYRWGIDRKRALLDREAQP